RRRQCIVKPCKYTRRPSEPRFGTRTEPGTKSVPDYHQALAPRPLRAPHPSSMMRDKHIMVDILERTSRLGTGTRYRGWYRSRNQRCLVSGRGARDGAVVARALLSEGSVGTTGTMRALLAGCSGRSLVSGLSAVSLQGAPIDTGNSSLSGLSRWSLGSSRSDGAVDLHHSSGCSLGSSGAGWSNVSGRSGGSDHSWVSLLAVLGGRRVLALGSLRSLLSLGSGRSGRAGRADDAGLSGRNGRGDDLAVVSVLAGCSGGSVVSVGSILSGWSGGTSSALLTGAALGRSFSVDNRAVATNSATSSSSLSSGSSSSVVGAEQPGGRSLNTVLTLSTAANSVDLHPHVTCARLQKVGLLDEMGLEGLHVRGEHRQRHHRGDHGCRGDHDSEESDSSHLPMLGRLLVDVHSRERRE
ncbi:hypothetical protein PMAYCL1PPCAC_05470, partial [Pristionchus mayeri]